jgi:hypothetical protein
LAFLEGPFVAEATICVAMPPMASVHILIPSSIVLLIKVSVATSTPDRTQQVAFSLPVPVVSAPRRGIGDRRKRREGARRGRGHDRALLGAGGFASLVRGHVLLLAMLERRKGAAVAVVAEVEFQAWHRGSGGDDVRGAAASACVSQYW